MRKENTFLSKLCLQENTIQGQSTEPSQYLANMTQPLGSLNPQRADHTVIGGSTWCKAISTEALYTSYRSALIPRFAQTETSAGQDGLEALGDSLIQGSGVVRVLCQLVQISRGGGELIH